MMADPRPELDLLEVAREVLKSEAQAILSLGERLGESFARAVDLLVSLRPSGHGRAVITGMGKSGAVARKGAATFASTGTPSFYLHPAEGVHGDLGMVTPVDIVVALSYSGETDEVAF
jgi:arabinose-5-phosphate isomerase